MRAEQGSALDTSQNTNSGHTGRRLAEIAALIEDYLRRRQSGERVREEELIAGNPHLLPELQDELRRVREVPPGPGDQVPLSVECPECCERIECASSSGNELICPKCGRAILIDASQTLSFGSTAAPEAEVVGQWARAAGLTTGFVLDGRYEIGEKLGDGGMAVVYRARDRQTGRDVALKMMRTQPGSTALKRFQREFRAISAMRHANCLEVFDLHESPQGAYFTMELFGGRSLTSLRRHALPVRVRGLLQAAEAVDYIHSQGIIHRDIKPSNLLVQTAFEGEEILELLVKLADFGLARFVNAPSSLTTKGGFVGTLLYSAPEQISNELLDHRVDLYALGVVCYELLTGRHPFEDHRDDDVRGLMQSHLNRMPERMRTFAPELPEELDQAVMALLAKQPVDRPTSASALRQVLSSIAGAPIEALTGTLAGPALPQWTQTTFVARQDEMAAARRVLQRALSVQGVGKAEWLREPIPSVVFIRGDAGIGKSRLLQEVVRQACELGASIHDGRCFEGNLAPYQPFVDILGQLLEGVEKDARRTGRGGNNVGQRTTPSIASNHVESRAPNSDVAALFDEFGPELLRIAPDLRKHISAEAFKQVDLNRESNYVLRAAASFFIGVASARPTCLCIDDLQWADQGTLDLLRHISSGLFRKREQSLGSADSGVPLLILCTIRPGQNDAGRLAGELVRQQQAVLLDLKPLTCADVTQLVERLLGPADEQFIEALHRRSQGNAFFVCECLRAWLATDRLTRSGGRWTALSSLADLDALPESVRDVIRSRVQALSNDARHVLLVASVIGTLIEMQVLRRVCDDLDDADFQDVVDELIASKIAFESGSGLELQLAHDIIREVCYQELSATRRAMLHRRVAEALEDQRARGQPRLSELLAHHYAAAGIHDKAFEYHVEAATVALRAYAADDAIYQLSQAQKVIPAGAPQDRKDRLQEMMALAYTAAGRPGDAIACYESVEKNCDDKLNRARIFDKIGQLHFRVGDFDRAVECCDQSLAQIGLRRPRTIPGTLTSIAASYARYFLPFRWPWERKLSGSRREGVVVARDVFNCLFYLWAQRSVIRCTQATSRQFALAVQTGDTAHLADAYGRLALHFSILSVNGLGLRAGRRALEYARLAGDAEVEAIVKGHVACVHYYGAHLPEAEGLFREALAVLDRRGDSWFRLFAYHNLRHLYGIRGDTESEILAAKTELEIGETVDDSEGKCWGSYGMANALARSGRLNEAHQHMQRAMTILSGRTNIIVEPTALQTYGFVHLQSGNYEAARDVLEKARGMMAANLGYVDYSLRCYPLLVEAILGPHWHDTQTVHSPADARRAWSVSRWGLFWAKRLPNTLPHALRARARAAWVRGKSKSAERYLMESIHSAEAIGARYDLARSCLDLAKIQPTERESCARRARELLSELHAVVPPE